MLSGQTSPDPREAQRQAPLLSRSFRHRRRARAEQQFLRTSKNLVRRSSFYRVYMCAANKRATGFGEVARPSSNGQSPVIIG